MIQWTWQSNACDVLSLGPRTAGRLATVGIRSVADLLAAKPLTVVERLQDERYTSATITSWQREARLIVELPVLPPDAARILGLAGYGDSERIARSSPTELLTAIESLCQSDDAPNWLRELKKPTIAEVCRWIGYAQESWTSSAA